MVGFNHPGFPLQRFMVATENQIMKARMTIFKTIRMINAVSVIPIITFSALVLLQSHEHPTGQRLQLST